MAIQIPNSAAVNMPAAPTIDADIASFISSGDATGDVAPGAVADDDASDDAAPAAGSTDTDEPTPDVLKPDDASEPAAAAPEGVDAKAMNAAIAKGDPKAFIESLGKQAEKLLGANAHKVLRLQVVEANKATAKAEALAKDLGIKYGDPIAMRLAGEKGDADTFVENLEKAAGATWAQIMQFVNKQAAGHEARLQTKRATAESETRAQAAARDTAMAEAKTWAASGLTKADAALAKECPEAVELCLAEIKAGYSKGITTPAKAAPLVRAKLKAQYDRLGKVFGAGAKPRTTVASPSTKLGNSEAPVTTRPMTLDEQIKAFTKENKYV